MLSFVSFYLNNNKELSFPVTFFYFFNRHFSLLCSPTHREGCARLTKIQLPQKIPEWHCVPYFTLAKQLHVYTLAAIKKKQQQSKALCHLCQGENGLVGNLGGVCRFSPIWPKHSSISFLVISLHCSLLVTWFQINCYETVKATCHFFPICSCSERVY